jgi:predicted signal transduction protein with EAL and GGDEF domain
MAGRDIVLGASIGVAASEPGADSAGDLLRNADIAMYRAKHGGKGRVVVFEPGMQAAVSERLELEAELRGVLLRDELELVFQPIVELAGGRTVGAEALLRWRHRSRGRLAPAQFFEAAEVAGVMPAIGRWSVERACAAAGAWPALDDGAGLPLLCVNVVPRLLANAAFVGAVERAMETAGLRPGQLVLEVAEGAAVEDAPATFAAMRALRGRGVRFAIDDFGAGFSSLSYLRDMPADILKLDPQFVAGVAGDPQSGRMAQGILDLARALGKLVIAEGVEQEAQAERLRELGCTLGQGFRYSPAVEAVELLRLLRRAAGGRAETVTSGKKEWNA